MPSGNSIQVLVLAIMGLSVLQFAICWFRAKLLARERNEAQMLALHHQQIVEKHKLEIREQEFLKSCYQSLVFGVGEVEWLLTEILKRCDEGTVAAMVNLTSQQTVAIVPNDCELQLNGHGLNKLRATTSIGPILLTREDFSQTNSAMDYLFAFRLGDNPFNRKFLLLGTIPHITGESTRDAEIVASMSHRLTDQLLAHRKWHQDAVEINVAREMLDLHILTDQNFTDPTELTEQFLKRLAELTGFERASLIMWDDETDEFGLVAWGGTIQASKLEAWEAAELAITASHQSGEKQIVLTPEYLLNESEPLPFRSGFITQLIHETDELGVLLLTSRDAIRPSSTDQQLAQWSARHLMEAMARTIDRAMIEDSVRRDALTQIANRRTFDEEFERITQQCLASSDGCCSVIMIDIDHFKSINDTYGHQAGDEVLRTTAKTLEAEIQNLRVSDRPLLARYGGEEFAVILPNTNNLGAIRIAEQLRRAVQNESIHYADRTISVTLSAGLATTPDHGRCRFELLSKADEALYRAKKQGRNRVVAADYESSETWLAEETTDLDAIGDSEPSHVHPSSVRR